MGGGHRRPLVGRAGGLGRWVDLDVLKRDGRPGEGLAAAVETIDLAPDGKPALPAALVHEIELRVVVERWDAGKSDARPCLRRTLRPAELAGQPVVLSVAPLDWPADLDLAAKGSAEKIKEALLRQKEWLPVLQVGEEQVIAGASTSTAPSTSTQR